MTQSVRRAFAVAMLLLLPVGQPATAQSGQATRLSNIRVTTQEDTATIFVKTSAPPKYQADLIDSPTRLVIDFEDTEYAWRKTPLAVSPAPLKLVRGSQYKKDTARVVVEFTRKVGYAIREDDNGLSIVIPTRASAATTRNVTMVPLPNARRATAASCRDSAALFCRNPSNVNCESWSPALHGPDCSVPPASHFTVPKLPASTRAFRLDGPAEGDTVLRSSAPPDALP